MIGPNRICCTNLGFELKSDGEDKELRAHFEQFGPVQSCELAVDQQGTSRGFAHITFADRRGLTACTGQWKHVVAGRNVQVNFDLPEEAEPPPPHLSFLQTSRIFVSYLAVPHLEPAQIRDMFAEFGCITQIRFEEDAYHRPLHCCLITFEDSTCVQRCLDAWRASPKHEKVFVKMAVRPEEVSRAKMAQKEYVNRQNSMMNMGNVPGQQQISYFSSMPSLLSSSPSIPASKRSRLD